MQTKKVEIQGSEATCIDEVYELLKNAFSMGYELHSNNADALWDIMPGYIDEPTVIIWYQHEKSARLLKSDYESVVSVLKDIEELDVRFKLELR